MMTICGDTGETNMLRVHHSMAEWGWYVIVLDEGDHLMMNCPKRFDSV